MSNVTYKERIKQLREPSLEGPQMGLGSLSAAQRTPRNTEEGRRWASTRPAETVKMPKT